MRQTTIAMLMLLVAIPALAFAGTSGPSPVPNPPNFQISTNSLLLCKGTVNYVPITVSNLGQLNGSITMEDLQLGLSSNRYLETVENGTTNTLTLPPRTTDTVILPIFVNLNSSTLVSAGISVNYNYLNYYSDSEIRNVSFGTESCQSQLSVAISPKVLVSGKIENVSFTLSNGGASQINDASLKATLSSQDGQILSSQPVEIKSIVPFGNAVINETLFVNTTAETFPINVSVSFYNGTQFEQLSEGVAVLSSGIINLTSTSVTLSPTTPSAGGIFSISFVLTNLGTTGASAVTATVVPPPGITAFGSNSVFIGSVGVDSQTPVTLSLSSSSSLKNGNYVVPIKISYLNNLRQQINSTINVPVSMSTFNSLAAGKGFGATGTTAKRSSGGGLIILILVIVVITLGYLLYKEKKKSNVKGSQNRK